MPMSRRARNDWLGSSTSPPLITRSNLSTGRMAARAGCQRPAAVPRAAELEPTRKSRRERINMAFPPRMARLRWAEPERQHVGGQGSNQGPRLREFPAGGALLGERRQPFRGFRRLAFARMTLDQP